MANILLMIRIVLGKTLVVSVHIRKTAKKLPHTSYLIVCVVAVLFLVTVIFIALLVLRYRLSFCGRAERETRHSVHH